MSDYAEGMKRAAEECRRLAESYTRSLAHYAEDDPERRKIKWGAAAVTVAAENILAALARAPAPDARAEGMREAAEMFHQEQVIVWVQDIVEGLGFADVLKIDSYDDNIAAHEVVEVGLTRIRDAILAAIPPAEAPDDEADLESPDFIRGWNAAMEAQGFEAIDPPPPWQPPPEAEREEVANLVAAAQEFCRRVEIGEVRSSRSYAAFKNALAAFAPLPPAPAQEDTP